MNDIPGQNRPSAARQRLTILATVVPTLLLGAKFVHVLFEPMAGGNLQWALDAGKLLVIEFFLLHVGFMSFGLMGTRGLMGILHTAVLGAFYLLLIALFTWLFESKALFAVAAFLLALRLGGAAPRRRVEFRGDVTVSVVGVLFYIGAVAGAALYFLLLGLFDFARLLRVRD